MADKILTAASSFFRNFLRRTPLNKFIFFLLSDIGLITLSLYLALLFHFNFNFNLQYSVLVWGVLPFFVVTKLSAFALLRVYRFTWRYVGLFDMINLVLALFVSAIILILMSAAEFTSFEMTITDFPKRVISADFIISLFVISGLRISKRLYREVLRKRAPQTGGKRTLIIGAGNAGEMILRDIIRQGFADYAPIGLLDDDPMKVGTYLHGVRVLDTTDRTEEVISRHGVVSVIIAIPSLDHKKLLSLYEAARKQNVVNIKVIPRIYNFNRPDINLRGLEEISIEDLIGRQTVCVDVREIESLLTGQVVLVTGAGGSIGAEIVMQVCTFNPSRLILFDIDETELHNLGLRLKRRFPDLGVQVHFMVGDIRDRERVQEVFQAHRPRIVFHAAAHKHVPLMEYNPKEAVKVNIFGTYVLAEAATAYHAERFIMISTDKAVRPTSVMGSTKRMAEYVCQSYNGGGTSFISVRFGNVLGSRGSVLPIFLDQLRYGEPITVTHPEMKRYFMTIPEAVTLVLEAAVIGRAGEILVLDMGEPVRIVDFATELIRVQGLDPNRDIDIVFTGLRPGEKLFEEVLTAEEGTDMSRHEKIFIARNSVGYSREEIKTILNEFKELLHDAPLDSVERTRALLRKYVAHYE